MAYDRFRFRGHDVIMHDSSQTAARDSGENGDGLFSLFKFNFNSFIANLLFYRELTAVARGELSWTKCGHIFPNMEMTDF